MEILKIDTYRKKILENISLIESKIKQVESEIRSMKNIATSNEVTLFNNLENMEAHDHFNDSKFI